VLAIPTIIQVPTVSCTQRTHISGLGSLQVQENGMPSALVTLISESVPTASNLYASEVQRIVRTKGPVAICRRWGISRLTVNQPKRSMSQDFGHECVLLVCEIQADDQEKSPSDQKMCCPILRTPVA